MEIDAELGQASPLLPMAPSPLRLRCSSTLQVLYLFLQVFGFNPNQCILELNNYDNQLSTDELQVKIFVAIEQYDELLVMNTHS